MSFLHLHAHSLWQNIKQRIRQWVKPENYSPALNAGLYLFRQFLIRHLPRAGRRMAPSIVSARRHLQRVAQSSHRVVIPVIFNELESHSFGCEKMATESVSRLGQTRDSHRRFRNRQYPFTPHIWGSNAI